MPLFRAGKRCRRHPHVIMIKTTSGRKGSKVGSREHKTWTCRLCARPYRRFW